MIPRVVQITDVAVLSVEELLSRVDRAAGAGPRFAVQLRDPALSGRELLELGRALRARTRVTGAQLHVDDRLDLALLLDADGIHLGRHSLEPAEARRALGGHVLVTRSAHDRGELERAASQADAALVSPIFASPGKGAGRGIAAITEARAAAPASFGIIALGGLDRDRARSCLSEGADGVASIRADLTPLAS